MPGAEHPLCIGSDTWPGLAKLAEESSELGQVIGKITAFPFLDKGERHPDGTNLDERLTEELADVHAAIEYVLRMNNRVQVPLFDARRKMKLRRFMGWDRDERARRRGI